LVVQLFVGLLKPWRQKILSRVPITGSINWIWKWVARNY